VGLAAAETSRCLAAGGAGAAERQAVRVKVAAKALAAPAVTVAAWVATVLAAEATEAMAGKAGLEAAAGKDWAEAALEVLEVQDSEAAA
jgi:hypothetical protein